MLGAWVLGTRAPGVVAPVALAAFTADEVFGPIQNLAIRFVTQALMGFGENTINNLDEVASLFGYFSGTAVVIILLLLMPPYRKGGWLSSIVSER